MQTSPESPGPQRVVSLRRRPPGEAALAVIVVLAVATIAGIVVSYIAGLVVVKLGIGLPRLFIVPMLLASGGLAWLLGTVLSSPAERAFAIVVGAGLGIAMFVGVDPTLVPYLEPRGETGVRLAEIPPLGEIAAMCACLAGFGLAGSAVFAVIKARHNRAPNRMPRMRLKDRQ